MDPSDARGIASYEILLKELKDLKIAFHIEYSQNTDELNIDVFYGEENFDIADSENELSLSIIGGVSALPCVMMK